MAKQQMTENEMRICEFKSFVGNSISPEFFNWLVDNGFFITPASIKYHGNHEGGLYEHSSAVATTLMELTDKLGLKWSRPSSPAIVGMFHDICKMDDYKVITDYEKLEYHDGTSQEVPVKTYWGYNKEPIQKGHGEKSVLMLSSLIQLTEEEMYCIRFHMGAFTDKEEWSFYTKAVNKYPNVLWTHQADMMAAHVLEV